MPKEETTMFDGDKEELSGFTLTGYRGHEYNFGFLVAKQNDRVMDAGRKKSRSDDELNEWLNTLNDLEGLLGGFWSDKDLIYITYKDDIKVLQGLPQNTKADKIKVGQLKFIALMRLQNQMDFQGLKKGNLE